MKMASVSSVTLILLCCSVATSKGSTDGCNQRVAEGEDITLTLGHKLEPTDSLKWVFNGKIILHKKPERILTGNATDIDEKGNLKRTKVEKKDSGIYTYEVHGNDGKSKAKKDIKLCVLDAVKNPTAKIKCNEPEVIFICSSDQQPPNTKYEWLEGNTVIGTGTPLKKGASETKAKKFACRVYNEVSSETSPPVSHNCKTEALPGLPDELFGISIWVFIGCGGGIVLLLIIIVIVCCVRTKRKKSMQLKDEEELRLGWTNSEQQSQHHCLPPLPGHHPTNQHHHHHQQQQHPAGHTGPRQSRPKQQRQQRPRAPEPSESQPQPQPQPRRTAQTPKPAQNDDEEQPPPLPQPRKKGPRSQAV